jgi:hypothetical protein
VKNSDLVDANMTTREVILVPSEVVYVKSIFEASLGVGVLFAEQGGVVTLAASHSRARDLDELLSDLQAELGTKMTTRLGVSEVMPCTGE